MDLDSDSLIRGISFDADNFLPSLENMLGMCTDVWTELSHHFLIY